MSWIHITKQCGIYYLPDPSESVHSPYWVPLVKISANAHISQYCANVTLSQTFAPSVSRYPGDTIREASYSFPLYPSSSVTSFVARIKANDVVVKTITGVVKSLPTAKKEYKEAIARGETAGFLEQVADDIFTMKLGNIPRDEGTEVEVDVGYVAELSHDTEVDGVRFTVPVTIAPRYGNAPEGVQSTLARKVVNGLEMRVEIDMPGPVLGVQSPSHPLAVTMGSFGDRNAEFDNKRAFATLTQASTALEKDFILQVLCKELSTPRAILEAHEDADGNIDSAALMVTLVPKFVLPRAENVRKEIIFLVDRSGSMYDKLDPLRSALKVFLKSLPPSEGVKFDICYFGSDYHFLFDSKGRSKGSQLYSKSTLDIAMKDVEKINADMGGTEIAHPIKEACERVLARNAEKNKRIAEAKQVEGDEIEWETELLVLTDGEVWDTDRMLDYVRTQTQDLRGKRTSSDGRAGIRVFTIGIGAGASYALVEGLAKAGGGYASFVGDNERFEGKVVRMLKAALSPRVGGYKLSFPGMENWNQDPHVKFVPDEEEFEVISSSSSSRTATPAPTQAPATISLFDESADPDAEFKASPVATPTLIPPTIISSPHVIPPLFSFQRTNVYLLLIPRSAHPPQLPEKMTLAAATSSNQRLQIDIPVRRLSTPGAKYLHQLATKKYLDDLKEGDSWLHNSRGSGKKLLCRKGDGATHTIEIPKVGHHDYKEDEFEDMVKAEGERIGVQWGVVGKWTAFVATEDNTGSQDEQVKKPRQPPPYSGIYYPPPPPSPGMISSNSNICYAMAGSAMGLRKLGYAPKARSRAPPPPPPPPPGTSSFSPPSRRLASAQVMVQSLPPPSMASTPPKRHYLAAQQQCQAAAPASRGGFFSALGERFGGGGSAADKGGPTTSCGFGSVTSASGAAAVVDDLFAPAPLASVVALSRGSKRRSAKAMEAAMDYEKESSEELMDYQDDDEEEVSKDAGLDFGIPFPNSPTDIATAAINLQNFEGSWDLSKAVVAMFAGVIAYEGAAQAVSSQAKEVLANVAAGEKEKVWATCLVLLLLEQKAKTEKDMWELVAEKGRDWMERIVGSAEGVEKVMGKAREVLGF